MKATATIYDLGRGVGVCHLRSGSECFVAEIVMDDLRVLPQSVRPILDEEIAVLEVDDEPTPQDHVDRAALGIERFRQRLAAFSVDGITGLDVAGLLAKADAAERELRSLQIAVRERA